MCICGFVLFCFFSLYLCLCLFFSVRNTKAENAGKLPRLVEGRGRAGRNPRGASQLQWLQGQAGNEASWV